jgi:endonuclease/exonuclease/phosphatase family metal-dependent hydrolase
MGSLGEGKILTSLRISFLTNFSLSGRRLFLANSDHPEKRIDYLFMTKPKKGSNLLPKCRHAETIQTKASDHFPLLVQW